MTLTWPRILYRMRDRCAVPRTFPQCVGTQRHNRIGRWSSSKYAPRAAHFPVSKAATIQTDSLPSGPGIRTAAAGPSCFRSDLDGYAASATREVDFCRIGLPRGGLWSSIESTSSTSSIVTMCLVPVSSRSAPAGQPSAPFASHERCAMMCVSAGGACLVAQRDRRHPRIAGFEAAAGRLVGAAAAPR
jgi:hypothetical protein